MSFNIFKILDQHHIPYRTTGDHTSRGWVNLDCPYCGPASGKFHLGYNEAFGNFNCWRCGKKNRTETLQALTGLHISKVRELSRQLPRKTEPGFLERAAGRLVLPKGLAPMQEAHRKYLRSRGYDPDELERRWSLQGLGLEAGELRWRIFIPVILHGKTVSWITRSISDKEVARRYYTATKKQEVYFHKDLLYGIDYARYSIVIVEGVFDAWRIGPGAVATFGTRVSDAQIVQIASFQERYICFDKGAERYSQRLVNELSLYPGKTYEVQLNAKDPGSATQKELKKLRRLIQ